MTQTRRQFLRHTSCGVVSASALLSGLGRFALIDALAQAPPGGYRALVCVFLFGGNDANNMVIPYTDYDVTYGAVRSGAVFAVPQADLLQINPPSTPGLTFGLHPRLDDSFGGTPSLYGLWNQGRVAVVCNTGPLIQPISRADYLAGTARPYQLFSHSDQQNLWQTAYANAPKQTGWGGSTVDNTGGSPGFPVVASTGGVTVFSTGQNTRPLVLAAAPTPLNGALKLFKYGNNPPEQALIDALTFDGQDPMPALVQGATQITTGSLAASASLNSDPMLATIFPNSSLGNQLKQVAKLISLAPQLGVSKQVFFVSLGGFDTHTGQGAFNTNQGQAGLLSQLSQAIGAFYSATLELGVSGAVTLFTSSDFSRTFVPGGGATGTDHAWGSHQLVVGDSVVGSDFYGQFPSLAIGMDQDTDSGAGARGRWIPTTSVDQYAATLADWYGLDPNNRPLVFPNIGNFSQQTLGFLGGGPAQPRKQSVPGRLPRTPLVGTRG
jgi:uncharacterized protein (DUF1501 family)